MLETPRTFRKHRIGVGNQYVQHDSRCLNCSLRPHWDSRATESSSSWSWFCSIQVHVISLMNCGCRDVWRETAQQDCKQWSQLIPCRVGTWSVTALWSLHVTWTCSSSHSVTVSTPSGDARPLTCWKHCRWQKIVVVSAMQNCWVDKLPLRNGDRATLLNVNLVYLYLFLSQLSVRIDSYSKCVSHDVDNFNSHLGYVSAQCSHEMQVNLCS
jgi:hypothetical protein